MADPKAPKLSAPKTDHKQFAEEVLASDLYREPIDKSRKGLKTDDPPDEDPDYRPDDVG